MAKKIDYASLFTLRKDGRYQGGYTDEKGKRHFVYDRDPERLYEKIESKKSGEKVETQYTFRKVAESWEDRHRAEIEDRTWSNYRPHYERITAQNGDRLFSDIEAVDVLNDLKIAKEKGYSRTVVNSIRSIYRMIFDHAIILGVAKYNPVSAIKLPKGLPHSVRRAPTDEEIKIICQNTDAPFGFFPFFLICTGTRRSEALALKWSDVDMKKKVISVTKSLDYSVGSSPKEKAPKTESGVRVIPIISVLYDKLLEAKKQSNSEYIFPASDSNRGGEGGGKMTERGYEGAWMRYCSSVGFVGDDGKPTLTAHNLRHGTATLMYENGVDVYTAKQILGHAKIETTMAIYTALRDAHKQKSIDKFGEGMLKLMGE